MRLKDRLILWCIVRGNDLKTLAVLEHENQQYYEIHVQLKNPIIHCTLVLKQESRHGYPRVLDLPAMRDLSGDHSIA